MRCRKCGQDHPKCAGHNRQGKPCGMKPAPEQRVCTRHGGASPQARAAAKTREVEARAQKALRARWAEGAEVAVTDPLGELARLAGEVVAFKDYLRGEVDKLDGLLTYWTERTYDDGDMIRTSAIENVRATVNAYERALDRANKVLEGIVKLDLAGKMLEQNARQADRIADAMLTALATVDMPAEIRRATQDAVADAILELSTTGPAPAPRELTA